MAEPAIGVRAAATALGVHENTIRNWMDRGRLRARVLPSGFRKPYLADVVRLMEESAPGGPDVVARELDALAEQLESRAANLRAAAAQVRGELAPIHEP